MSTHGRFMYSNLAGLPSLERGYFRVLFFLSTFRLSESRINPSGALVSQSSIEPL